jgi:terminase small subunit-like protein
MQITMRTKLTPKQDAFVQDYAKTRNATKSALMAGYSPRTARQQGSRLLSNVDIQQRLEGLVTVGLDALEDVAINGKVEIARVASAKVLVETGLGKPKANNQNDFGDITINIMRLDPATLKTIPVKFNH